jgi:hypothetical protein
MHRFDAKAEASLPHFKKNIIMKNVLPISNTAYYHLGINATSTLLQKMSLSYLLGPQLS